MSAAAASKVRRGDVKHAIVVRTAKKVQRKDGMVVRFDDNACALIGKNGEPLGTRINGEDQNPGLNVSSRDCMGQYANNETRRCGVGASRQTLVENPFISIDARMNNCKFQMSFNSTENPLHLLRCE